MLQAQFFERLNSAHRLERNHRTRRKHRQLEVRRFVSSQWHRLTGDLFRERGLWGPALPSALDKWMLDPNEGLSRMRRKLRPNPSFYLDYPYDPADDDINNIENQVGKTYVQSSLVNLRDDCAMNCVLLLKLRPMSCCRRPNLPISTFPCFHIYLLILHTYSSTLSPFIRTCRRSASP